MNPSTPKPLITVTIILALLLAACGSEPEPEADQEQAAHILEPQTQALDRARAVEDQVLDAAEQTREAIDEQSGEPDDG